jgi:hypothetical protein
MKLVAVFMGSNMSAPLCVGTSHIVFSICSAHMYCTLMLISLHKESNGYLSCLLIKLLAFLEQVATGTCSVKKYELCLTPSVELIKCQQSA